CLALAGVCLLGWRPAGERTPRPEFTAERRDPNESKLQAETEGTGPDAEPPVEGAGPASAGGGEQQQPAAAGGGAAASAAAERSTGETARGGGGRGCPGGG